MFETLITAEEARQGIGRAGWRFVDCRFQIRDPGAGRQAYEEGHIPGAVYAHLDDDLSGPIIPGVTGRHPLPDEDSVTALIRRLGIRAGMQVVVYDDLGGRIAARLWWTLRYAGLDAVAVLDGGWPAWLEAGMEQSRDGVTVSPSDFNPTFQREQVVSTEMLVAWMAEQKLPLLLDARAPERYRGEVEPLDPVAGHIAGARSVPCADSLTAEGRFRDRASLREALKPLVSTGADVDDVAIAYCGSGVTACHLILAMSHAGLERPRLYPGSWSEWCLDSQRPISKSP